MKWLVGKIWILALILPVIIVFRAILSTAQIAWGDAPYFFPQGLKELINEPLAWTNRGINLGGVNLLVWVSPLMIVYGLLGSLFNLGTDLLVRLIFYIPGVIFSLLGAYRLANTITKSHRASIITALVYNLNTYFLLLVDGGQVGIALAYGLFPVALLFLKNLFDKPTLKHFYQALAVLFVCSIADPRIALLTVLTLAVWQIHAFKNFWNLALLVVSWLALSSYWLLPLLANQKYTLTSLASPANLKIIHALTLFSPHWPANIFGQVGSPNWYFFLVPILVTLSVVISFLWHRQKLKELLPFFGCYLFFCLLAISFGLILKLPFGQAFRDTSKFFVPIILFAGLLLGCLVDMVNKKLFSLVMYIFLLILVWQALAGKMNFVLSDRVPNLDFTKIANKLQEDSDFYRTLWLPERPPTAFDETTHPALDGNSLINLPPFGHITAGEDPFNFLNSPNYIDWLKLLGVRYLILADNQRALVKTDEEDRNWQGIKTLIVKTKGLFPEKWNLVTPVYKLDGSLPRFFSVKTIYGVIGKPFTSPNIPNFNFEDGIFDPNSLVEMDPKSFSLLFNGGTKEDLVMSFLQKYFKSPRESTNPEWAVYAHSEYLKYKYQLAIRGLNFESLDYGLGIAFSTRSNEKLSFHFTLSKPGDYLVAVRSLDTSLSDTALSWKFEKVSITSKSYVKIITNQTGLGVVNAVALIPAGEFAQASELASSLQKIYPEKRLNQLDFTNLYYTEVKPTLLTTLRYGFETWGDDNWLIFSDNFSSGWQLKAGGILNSYPAYSMINAFYIDPKWQKFDISFLGQKNIRWGIYFSVITGLILSIIFFWRNSKDA